MAISPNTGPDIYSVSANGLFFRDFGLRDQIRRAAISIASNIAEGFESQTNRSFCRYLATARGSAAEVRAQLYLAQDLGYISEADSADLRSLCESVSLQISGFIRYLEGQAYRKE